MTPEVVIRARLTGVGIMKPRHHAPHILWAASNQEQMEELRREKAITETSLGVASDPTITSSSKNPTNPPAPTNTSSNPSIPTAAVEVFESPSATNASSTPSIPTAAPVKNPSTAPTDVPASVNGSSKKKNKKGKKKVTAGDASKDKGNEGKKKRKSNTTAADFQAAASRGYDALTTEEKEIWEDLSEEDFENCMAEYQELLTGAALTSPETCQRVINALPWLAQGFLDLIMEYTCMTSGFWAAGPELKYGGKPNVISAYSGTTVGPAGMHFGRAYRTEWKETVVPLIGKFLCKVYSIKECCSHALSGDSVLHQDNANRKGKTADKPETSVQVDPVKDWHGPEGMTRMGSAAKVGSEALSGNCATASDTIMINMDVPSAPPCGPPLGPADPMEVDFNAPSSPLPSNCNAPSPLPGDDGAIFGSSRACPIAPSPTCRSVAAQRAQASEPNTPTPPL
ncbi:hypothetical protein BT96DRAFT_1001758 [Gymnopus androsaceus JB14]|uniref:Uncharacterized protein n=1 Tax=Gymnopus androsaceus JB14 TaxID=1447944 RepID=A0A6A4H0Z5_9AGAR|nr:hypothetical protein BT96DRAFT_1001758 [Gymnopus androsaceus JB14]